MKKKTLSKRFRYVSAVALVAIFACSGDNETEAPQSSSSGDSSSSDEQVFDSSSSSDLEQLLSSCSSTLISSSSDGKGNSSSSYLISSNSNSSSSAVVTVSSSSSKLSSSSVTVQSSSSYFSSSSNNQSSSSATPSSSSQTPSSSSQDWTWLNNLFPGGDYYQNNQMTHNQATAQSGGSLNGCVGSPTPVNPFRTYPHPDSVIAAHPGFASTHCLVPVQLMDKDGNPVAPAEWYAISAAPTTSDDENTLVDAASAGKNGLGYIYKGILECMAREGSSGCSEEKTAPCDGTGEVLTFYRAGAPKTTAAAKEQIRAVFCARQQ